MTIDYQSEQADGITKSHIEMRANAKYKGEVGENAYLEGPVYAEIDYAYNQSGSFQDKRGRAITTTAPIHIEQHIKIPFFVSKDMTPPTFTVGKQHTVSCTADSCKEYDTPVSVDPGLPGEIDGKLDGLNHLQGSQSDVKSNLGRAHNGSQTSTLTWDLARQGSSQ
jgi:hypothetical protein